MLRSSTVCRFMQRGWYHVSGHADLARFRPERPALMRLPASKQETGTVGVLQRTCLLWDSSDEPGEVKILKDLPNLEGVPRSRRWARYTAATLRHTRPKLVEALSTRVRSRGDTVNGKTVQPLGRVQVSQGMSFIMRRALESCSRTTMVQSPWATLAAFEGPTIAPHLLEEGAVCEAPASCEDTQAVAVGDWNQHVPHFAKKKSTFLAAEDQREIPYCCRCPSAPVEILDAVHEGEDSR